MNRSLLAIVAILGVAVGGLFVYLLRPAPPPPPDPFGETEVRAIVTQMLAERDTALEAKGPINTAEIDPSILNPMIEDYLMGDPKVLQRMSQKLETVVRAEEAQAAKAAIATMQDAIYNDPDHIILGNPEGDVTLVEMFDYNCSYCRGALPDLATLIAEDPNLKVVLKEFPILSRDSVEAARVAVVASEQPGFDYWAFHQALFSTRGPVTADVALQTVEKQGLSRVSVELEMQSDKTTAVIQKSYDIAKALNVSGTPTYIIGDEIIPGAIGIDELRTRITNMRTCGATVCDPGEEAPIVTAPESMGMAPA